VIRGGRRSTGKIITRDKHTSLIPNLTLSLFLPSLPPLLPLSLSRPTMKDQVLPRTHALAAAIARASPVAVRSTLQTLRQMQEGREGGMEGGGRLERALQREAESQTVCYESVDYMEGLAAVQEKRRPVFPPFRS
jgi:enoyl-CoA hydratase/carnithine racemase